MTMPQENIPTITGRRYVRLVLSVLSVVLIVNSTIYFSGAFTNLDSGVFLIRSKWNLVRDLDEPVEWIILGDSTANQSVVPDLISPKNDGSAINLGTVGNALLIEDVWMLKDYIRSHGEPKNVVIVHVYDMWVRGADTTVFAHMPWDYMPDANMFRSVGERIELLWYRYVPIFQSETQVIRAISNPSRMFSQPIPMGDDGYTSIASPNPSIVEQDIESHRTRILNTEFKISEANLWAINELVEMANSHDMNIFVANSPVHEDLVGLDNFSSYFANVRELLRDMDSRSPNIRYILQDLPTFDSGVMENADHLTHDGAQTFTSQIIIDIEKVLGK